MENERDGGRSVIYGTICNVYRSRCTNASVEQQVFKAASPGQDRDKVVKLDRRLMRKIQASLNRWPWRHSYFPSLHEKLYRSRCKLSPSIRSECHCGTGLFPVRVCPSLSFSGSIRRCFGSMLENDSEEKEFIDKSYLLFFFLRIISSLEIWKLIYLYNNVQITYLYFNY